MYMFENVIISYHYFIKSKKSEMSFVVPSFSLKFFNLKCSFNPIFQDFHSKTCHKVEKINRSFFIFINFDLPLIFLFFKLITKIKSSFSHTVIIIVIYDSAHIPLEWWMF